MSLLPDLALYPYRLRYVRLSAYLSVQLFRRRHSPRIDAIIFFYRLRLCTLNTKKWFNEDKRNLILLFAYFFNVYVQVFFAFLQLLYWVFCEYFCMLLFILPLLMSTSRGFGVLMVLRVTGLYFRCSCLWSDVRAVFITFLIRGFSYAWRKLTCMRTNTIFAETDTSLFLSPSLWNGCMHRQVCACHWRQLRGHVICHYMADRTGKKGKGFP